MKKGRHRRFEEARALKRMGTDFDEVLEGENEEPCDECGADPGHDHAGWCRASDALKEEDWAG
jgi:hypothetical protein